MTAKPMFEATVVEAERVLRRYGAIDYSDPKLGLDLYVRAQAMIYRDNAEVIREAADKNKLVNVIADELGLRVPSPKTRGPMPGRYALRDRQIIMAVFRVSHEMNIAPTRNDEAEKLSACDAVADAWVRLYQRGEVSKPISYEYVKELWKQRPGKGMK
ncbi:hypothetical protein [Roseobacter litoralis]|uniref:hypothetical protein n=1 Tax=Roseobacter litoralis TaxID=42443 RepID=UPI0024911A1D|nr:hypothetical protein [Roseobacter litoralis]